MSASINLLKVEISFWYKVLLSLMQHWILLPLLLLLLLVIEPTPFLSRLKKKKKEIVMRN